MSIFDVYISIFLSLGFIMTKYIFILGGVISGLGKGVTSGSIGAILKEMGLNITIKKSALFLSF